MKHDVGLIVAIALLGIGGLLTILSSSLGLMGYYDAKVFGIVGGIASLIVIGVSSGRATNGGWPPELAIHGQAFPIADIRWGWLGAGMIWFALLAASSIPNMPLAKGAEASVAAATRAAQACGMTNLRHERLDGERSRLLIGKGNSREAVDCTLAWMKAHWSSMHFEPIMIGNKAPDRWSPNSGRATALAHPIRSATNAPITDIDNQD
jgi:hypothetical protein